MIIYLSTLSTSIHLNELWKFHREHMHMLSLFPNQNLQAWGPCIEYKCIINARCSVGDTVQSSDATEFLGLPASLVLLLQHHISAKALAD